MAENPAGPDPKHRWRSSSKPAEGFQRVAVKTSARHRTALILAGLILALAGAIAAWFFYPHSLPETAFVTIPIREYTFRQFPANDFALQDSELLLRHFPQELRTEAYTSQTRERLLSELNALQARTGEALVLHLRAHAVRDDKGVSILPGDADPGNRATWVPLDDVLEKLRKCPVQHKLLLLDIMRPVADAKLGILSDDVAEGVKTVLDKEETPGLLVLCACAPGQVSLVSDDLHVSVFGYYLDQGLAGRADGYNATGSRDDRVTVKELADYVRKHVDRWARHNRGTRQTPVLYGKGEDFALVGYKLEEIPPLTDLPPAEPLPQWLSDLWKMRDAWQTVGVYRRAPRALQRFEALLLRAEERWRGGIEVARIRDELGQDLLRVTRLADEAKPPPPREAHSLTLARGPDKPADPAATEALHGLLNVVAPESAAKPEEVAKARAAFQEKFKDLPYRAMAAAVFETAVKDTTLTTKKVRLLQQVLDSWKGQPRYVETAYLQRLLVLAQKAEDKEWPWRVEIMNQLLKTVREGEKAAAADPAALPWIEADMQAADQKRRQGEKVLFTERYTSWAQAAALLQEAEAAYRTINANTDLLAAARQVRDDALTFLPGYVPYLNQLRERDPEEVRTWRSGLRAALDLYQSMVKPDPALLEGLDERRGEVRGYLGSVQRSYDFRRSRFVGLDKQATVSDYAEFAVLMASPRLAAPQRVALWSAGRKLARELLVETRQADEAEARGTALPPGFAAAADADARGVEVGSPARRAQLAIDLLNLGGLKEAGRLQQALAKASGEPTDANWRSLGASLYTAWAKDVPAQLAASRSDLTKLDRLSRINDLLGQSQEAGTSFDRRLAIPQAEVRRQEVAHYWQWLGQRFQAESKAAGDTTPYGIFCADAAEDYLR